MKRIIAFLLFCRGVCLAQDATWEFLCEGHTNWASAIKFFTTADRIRRVGPLDHVYGNACDAQKGGDLSVSVDSTNHSVELRVDPPREPYGCPRNYSPVYSMAVEFGPLIAGDWVFWSSAYQFTNKFTVYPDPGPALLNMTIGTNAVLADWQAVGYLNYDLETSADLRSWHSTQLTYTLNGSVMSVQIPLESQCQFFRVKRSSITQIIPFFPTDCGQ